MSESFESTRSAEIADFVGKHIIYTYENGWQYEVYIKNERTIDYRFHGGLVGGRWEKGQEVHIDPKVDEMLRCRDAGPAYPTLLVDEFAAITFVEDRGIDDEEVISCPPEEVPPGDMARRNVGV